MKSKEPQRTDEQQAARLKKLQLQLDVHRRKQTWPDDGLPIGHFLAFLRGVDHYDDLAGPGVELEDEEARELAAALYQSMSEKGPHPPSPKEFRTVGFTAAAMIDVRLAGFDVNDYAGVVEALQDDRFRKHKKRMWRRAKRELPALLKKVEQQKTEQAAEEQRAAAVRAETRALQAVDAVLSEVLRYHRDGWDAANHQQVIQASWKAIEDFAYWHLFGPYDGKPPQRLVDDFVRGVLPDGSRFTFPAGVYLTSDDLIFDRAVESVFKSGPPDDLIEALRTAKQRSTPNTAPYVRPRDRPATLN